MNDRANHRIQVFDENGKYQYEWSPGEEPSDIHLLYIGADRTLWAFDRGTSKMLKYDLDGHFLYSWGVWCDFPGGFWGVHGFSVDQEGNFYVAEVDNGRVQKFRPRQGVNESARWQAGLLGVEMKTHTNVRRFMKLGAMLLGVCILTAAFATGQQPGRASRPQMAEDVFKNVQVWRAPT